MTREKTILCVDDDAYTVELLKMMFNLKGFVVSLATTSEEGLYYAKEGGFAAIILDNKLPDNTGSDLCREIREFDSRTPIIFLTASILERDREEALLAGTQEYLLKPDNVENIIDKVMQYIKLTQTKGT